MYLRVGDGEEIQIGEVGISVAVTWDRDRSALKADIDPATMRRRLADALRDAADDLYHAAARDDLEREKEGP